MPWQLQKIRRVHKTDHARVVLWIRKVTISRQQWKQGFPSWRLRVLDGFRPALNCWSVAFQQLSLWYSAGVRLVIGGLWTGDRLVRTSSSPGESWWGLSQVNSVVHIDHTKTKQNKLNVTIIEILPDVQYCTRRHMYTCKINSIVLYQLLMVWRESNCVRGRFRNRSTNPTIKAWDHRNTRQMGIGFASKNNRTSS